jgi:hypothetical protein
MDFAPGPRDAVSIGSLNITTTDDAPIPVEEVESLIRAARAYFGDGARLTVRIGHPLEWNCFEWTFEAWAE